jgi:GTP cyclohydrolase I
LVDRDVVDLGLHRVMELHHRAVSREQLRRFEGYLAEIFAACGLNLNTPATEETPRRFARRFTVQERLGEQIVHTCDA